MLVASALSIMSCAKNNTTVTNEIPKTKEILPDVLIF